MQKVIAVGIIILTLPVLFYGCSLGIDKLRQMIKQDIQVAFKDSLSYYGKK